MVGLQKVDKVSFLIKVFSPGMQMLYKIGICNCNCIYFDELS